jgi:hypothetical protein
MRLFAIIVLYAIITVSIVVYSNYVALGPVAIKTAMF